MVTVGSILSGTFRFMGDNVRSILIWSGLLTLVTLLSMMAMRPFYAQRLAEAQPGAPNFGMFGLAMILFLIFFVAQFAAVFRAVLFPQESRFAYLRLGMDELRLFGTMLVLGLGGGIAFGICFAVLAVIAGLLSVIFGQAVSAVVVVNLLGFVLMLVLFGAFILCWVRLSLAAPMTILQHKVVIGPAWRATRGVFWRLFGAYLVAFLLIAIVYAVMATVQTGPILGDMFRPTDPAAHQRVLAWQAANYGMSLRTVVFAALGGLLYGVGNAFQGGVLAVATVQLLDLRGGQHLSEVFE